MDRIELFLALIVFLLAIQVYETAAMYTSGFFVLPVLIIMYLFPLYLVGAIIIENVIGG